jgi:hypothetical protein
MISKKMAWLFANSYLTKAMELKDISCITKIFLVLRNLDILIYGLIRVIEFFSLQKYHVTKAATSNVEVTDHLVLESQAPHMHLNYFRHFNQSHNEHTYLIIKCFDKYDFTKIAPLNFWNLLHELCGTFFELVMAIHFTKTRVLNKDLKSKARKELPVFSYLTCLFRALKERNPNIKLFSGGAHLASAAAIAEGIETFWLAHGIIDMALPAEEAPSSDTHILSYPNFNFIYLYSKDEIEYLKKFSVDSNFYNYQFKKITNHISKTIFFTSPFHTPEERNTLLEALEFFQIKEYQIILKLHPSYTYDLPSNIFNDQGVKVLNSDGKPASHLIEQENPSFVCAFASTTLCEALYQDVIPICLSEGKDPLSAYPFNNRSISWKDEKSIIQKYLQNPHNDLRTSLLKTLNDDF